MVKEKRKGRSRSSSSDSEDSDYETRRNRSRSRSPKHSHKASKKRHKEEKLIDVSRIKREPVSDSDQEERQSKRRIKEEYNQERSYERRRDHVKQERVRDRPRHIKQERPDSDDERRQQHRERRRHDDRRRETHRQRQSNLSEHERYGRREGENTNTDAAEAKPKEAPNFELSGKLTEDTNTYKGIVIKYNEPPEARKPKKRWRLYPFKNDEPMKPFHMHRQSAFLMGRERLIADIPIDHPSCSKQHAVFQYRMVPYEKEDGRRAFRIAPYIIDLNSANGTFVNNKKIEPQRYVELMEKDVLKFGFSSREYVLLHDRSDTREIESDSD